MGAAGAEAAAMSGQGIFQAAEKVAGVLRSRGVEPIVIGALALAAHHFVRQTRDLDLGVEAEVRVLRLITEDLRATGFEAALREPDLDDPLAGVIDVTGPFGMVQVINFADRFPAAVRDSLREASLHLAEGSSIPVAPLAQIVALKLYAGGLRSRADIFDLLLRNPAADLDEIARVCRRYRLRGLQPILTELRAQRGEQPES